jgi:large subunit ribosomal protein L17
MMRHGNRVKHLGRPADQRKALVRGLVTQVIRNGAIRTTKVRGNARHEPKRPMRVRGAAV